MSRRCTARRVWLVAALAGATVVGSWQVATPAAALTDRGDDGGLARVPFHAQVADACVKGPPSARTLGTDGRRAPGLGVLAFVGACDARLQTLLGARRTPDSVRALLDASDERDERNQIRALRSALGSTPDPAA